jgi:hypothetical protein
MTDHNVISGVRSPSRSRACLLSGGDGPHLLDVLLKELGDLRAGEVVYDDFILFASFPHKDAYARHNGTAPSRRTAAPRSMASL